MGDPSDSKRGYCLRQESRLPYRYRDYYDEDIRPQTSQSPSKTGKRGRPSSPSKRVILAPSDSPLIVDDPPDPLLSPQKRTSSRKIVSALTQDELRRTTYHSLTPGPKRIAQSELTTALKDNLKRLKNLLKLPQARRWVYCEFFYSGVDEQLLLADNEFSSMLQQSFPNVKTRRMCRPEWRAIRRLIGKPRRCSAAFLDEERKSLEGKRIKIRQIYEGQNVAQLESSGELLDLPQRLPRSLVVGMKVFARVRSPKDGVYAGTIDAVLPDSYRIVFDKEDLIAPMIVRDTEVMVEGKLELAPLQYFIEQSRVHMPSSVVKLGGQGYTASRLIAVEKLKGEGGKFRRMDNNRDEKVGNFPVRMLVILVKLAKLIEHKRILIRQLTELNNEAERTNLMADSYSVAFQEKYASLVVDIEALNKQMANYLNGIQEYYNSLLPQLSEVPVTSRPEALRKLCHTHAFQIVKHCNNGLNVQNKGARSLITSLTALLLQVRSLGQQKCSALDLSTLSESLNEIRSTISPRNVAAFQDHVEVHMKQIHGMMVSSGVV